VAAGLVASGVSATSQGEGVAMNLCGGGVGTLMLLEPNLPWITACSLKKIKNLGVAMDYCVIFLRRLNGEEMIYVNVMFLCAVLTTYLHFLMFVQQISTYLGG